MVENNFCKNKKQNIVLLQYWEKIQLFKKSIHKRAKQYCFNNINWSVLKSIQSVLGTRGAKGKKKKSIFPPNTVTEGGVTAGAELGDSFFLFKDTFSYKNIPNCSLSQSSIL